MTSSNRYLQARLKLQVKAAKSAVDRPWNRKFLGYSMTFHKQPRLKVAPAVVARLKESVREECRKGRSRSLQKVIDLLSLKLRGGVNYFKLAEVKTAFSCRCWSTTVNFKVLHEPPYTEPYVWWCRRMARGSSIICPMKTECYDLKGEPLWMDGKPFSVWLCEKNNKIIPNPA